MELDVSEYRHECPICKTKTNTGLIGAKENIRRYFCSECCCEFEITSMGLIRIFKLTESGQMYELDNL